MQNHGKIKTLFVVIILNIIVLGFLSNFTYGRLLHDQTLYELTKQTPAQIADILVGKYPDGIDVNSDTGRIYVANFDDNTVSVIDETTHTLIGKPISVGKEPWAIG